MSEKVYSVDGYNGKHLDVYEDRAVLTGKKTLNAFIMGNACFGEKTIFFTDCTGIQFKAAGFSVGFVQFETSNSGKQDAGFFHNIDDENAITWSGKEWNDAFKEIAAYCKNQIAAYKSGKDNQKVVAISPAEELKKFKELLDMGIITQEEFDAKKKQILGI